MYAATSKLSCFPDILPDETFSSWFRRVASANGLNARELYAFLMPGCQLAGYDLDRHACRNLLENLSAVSDLSLKRLHSMMLTKWDGIVAGSAGEKEKIWWLAPSGRNSRKRSFGQRICVECLAEDDKPYYRDTWRLGFISDCLVHEMKLIDRCFSCGEPVQILASAQIDHAHRTCWKCASFYERDVFDQGTTTIERDCQTALANVLTEHWVNLGDHGYVHSVVYFRILYILMRLLTTGRLAKVLRYKIDEEPDAPDFGNLEAPRAKEIEHLSPKFRSGLVARAWWLTLDWPHRLQSVLSRAEAVSGELFKGNKIYPFPLEAAIRENLTKSIDRAEDLEIEAAVKVLQHRGIKPTRLSVQELIGKKFSADCPDIEPARTCATYGTGRYWKLDGVSPEVREAAKVAARKSGENVGTWVDDALRSVLSRRRQI